MHFQSFTSQQRKLGSLYYKGNGYKFYCHGDDYNFFLGREDKEIKYKNMGTNV